MNFDELKSDEERAFYAWLCDAYKLGLVSNAWYERDVFTIHDNQRIRVGTRLKTKIRPDEVSLFTNAGAIEYTPDFAVELTEAGRAMLFNVFKRGIQLSASDELTVDTKGSGGKHGSNQVFFLKQRMLYDRYGIFVEKVVPDALFKKTWAPDSLRWMADGARKVPTLNALGRKTCTAAEWFGNNEWMVG